MSHYGVLVVGGNIEAQLAPYHEFESTGKNDQYVQEIDQTEKALAVFKEDTTTRYRDFEGNLCSPYTEDGDYNPMFWRELTPEEFKKYGKQDFLGFTRPENGLRIEYTDWHDSKGYRGKAFAWPGAGWSEVKVLTDSVETFAQFCDDYYGHPVVPFGTEPDLAEKHKFGYTIVDEQGEVVKTIDRTNPGKKWDWYGIGGRWNGYFKLKPLAVGVLGKPGANFDRDYMPPSADRADICMKGDIDIEGMRNEAADKANIRYSMFETVTFGLWKPLSWEQMQEKHRITGIDTDGETTPLIDDDGEPLVNWKAAREEYGKQAMVKALHENSETRWFELEDFLCTREEYVRRFRDSALTLFAVIKDGMWYERGTMGWWGVVHDEKDRNEWNAQFAALINGLPDDALLTVVDCHI